MLWQVTETLLPLIVLVALGAVLVRFGFVSDALRRQSDRWVYWVGLPALLVAKVAESGGLDASIGGVVLALALATLVATVAAWGVWTLMGGKRETMGVVVQAGMRGNLAFVGLPVIALGGGDGRTLAIAAIAIAPTVALYNLIAVGALTMGQPGQGPGGGRMLHPAMLVRVVKSMATNPLILACVAGLALAGSGVTLPKAAVQSLNLVGQPAGPLALMSLGGALVVYRIKGHLAVSGATALVKLAVCPLVAWGLAHALGLDRQQAMALLVLAATPTAVASYVLVTQLGGNEALAASIIAVTTLGSVFSLGAALALAQGW